MWSVFLVRFDHAFLPMGRGVDPSKFVDWGWDESVCGWITMGSHHLEVLLHERRMLGNAMGNTRWESVGGFYPHAYLLTR
jgi:hypothetical protein